MLSPEDCLDRVPQAREPLWLLVACETQRNRWDGNVYGEPPRDYRMPIDGEDFEE